MPVPNADTFLRWEKLLIRSLCGAANEVAFPMFFPNADVTLRIRDGQWVGIDIRQQMPIPS